MRVPEMIWTLLFVVFGIGILLLIEKLLPTIGILIVITIGILLDLLSCYCYIRQNQTGTGPSGQPLATLCLFYLPPLLITEHAVFTSYYWLDCLILACFHIVVVIMIPIIHRRWFHP
jgi:hypothetical protein